MPCQVSWQFVAIKLQPSVHALGAEADGAFIGMTSAAQASTPQEAPPAAMITAAKNAELCTVSLPGSTCTIVCRYKVGRQDRVGAICSDVRKFRSEWQPGHSHLKRPNGFGGDSCCGATADESLHLGQTRRFSLRRVMSVVPPI